MQDLISRQAAIDAIEHRLAEPAYQHTGEDWYVGMNCAESELYELPSVQPERNWHSCGEPPKHHKNVLVRGIEAIGNVTVHKVMQWDVDRWRPTDYAPSIVWQEWSEI